MLPTNSYSGRIVDFFFEALDPFQCDVCDGYDASPVIGVVRARVYTSIREVPSQVLQGGKNENHEPNGAAQSSCVNFTHKKGAEARAERAATPARSLASSTFVFLIALLTCFARGASAYPKGGVRHEFGRSQCITSRALKIRKLYRVGREGFG